jgi:putative DNA primase/helicase
MAEEEQGKPDENADDENVIDLNFWRATQSKKEEEKVADFDWGGGGGGPPDGSEPTDEDPRPLWATDDALAMQIANQLLGSWFYVALWGKWFSWDGKLWKRDEGLSVLNRIREVCRRVSITIVRLASKGSPKPIVPSLARSVSSGRTVFNVERLARADDRIQRSADDFDANEWLLNTPGGIVDLRNGELYEHRREQLMTQMAGATPEGDCPVWRKFLHEFTDGDRDYQDYLQRLVGYSLTGSTEEEILVFLHGPANTGKSKFIETVRALHGTYGCSSSMDTFIATQNHAHATEIARFVGKRLVTAAETDEGCRWDQQRMTTLTGRDEITANFMRQDQFSYYPKFLLMFAGNHRPRILADGGAMRRRMHLLPCRHRPTKIDKQLIDKLKAELGGIMKWAVLGAVLWKQHGLKPPQLVTAATEDYFATEDALSTWIDERCELVKSLNSLTHNLYLDYKEWAKMANEYVLSEKRFTNMLMSMGFNPWKHPTTRRHGFSGIVLKASSQELPI